MVNCRFYVTATYVPSDKVRPLLPKGYSTKGVSSAVTSVGLQIYDCEAFVVDNQTVIKAARIAVVLAAVSTNETLSKGADSSFYLLESFAEQDSIVGLMARLGFNTTKAAIELSNKSTNAGANISANVTVGGELWYHAEGGSGEGPTAEVATKDRWHQVSASGHAIWANDDRVHQQPSYPGPGTIVAKHGVLKHFETTEDAPIGGIMWLTSSKDRMSFGKLPL